MVQSRKDISKRTKQIVSGIVKWRQHMQMTLIGTVLKAQCQILYYFDSKISTLKTLEIPDAT